ncbi:GDSL esterase/lipase At2g23540 [Cryptomeria japonica]|uniref:GDSL esterase/lipase At2g23540 n=1 Tax=Cryptomeria japonica TaxID=3369 RepID=UPI0027DA2D13|nr:GDSL esterase/lipase At2g23540 [Cryptomeria japonica]
MSMSQQVSLFEQYSDKLTEAEQGNLGNSLFAIVSGSNDIPSFISYFFKQRKNRDEFADLLLSKLTEHITRLYNHGARKFIVFDIPPLGCSPFFRHVAKLLPPLSDDKGCLEFLNFVVEPYSIAFRTSLTELAEKLDEATIIQVNDHDLVMNFIENGEAYGFINTTWACCGSGDFHTYPGCGKTNPPDLYCSDPNSYMFWDGGRGTEKLYSLISEQIWSGNTSFVYPFNLSTLLSAETCLNTNDASTLSEM